jgi:D-glycero-D-manno-heptose 1,7-bisphosphate phosphatase
MNRAVFLDRDNTLIANDGDLGDPAAVRLLDGVAAGLRRLHEAGYRLIVVTNQGGVARGAFSEGDVDAVHQRIGTLVDEAAQTSGLVDRFYYCPYHPDAVLEEYRRDHPWRKPQPGMLLQAAHDLDLDLGDCWLVGDQARDIAAGHAAGCRTVLISARSGGDPQPTLTAPSFDRAVDAIIDAAAESPARISRASLPAPPLAGNPGPTHIAGGRSTTDDAEVDLRSVRNALSDLAEEIRSDRLRRTEFTGFRMAAGLCLLLALLLAVVGLLQLPAGDLLVPWMLGAIFAQLIAIAILLLDLKG